MKIYIDNDMRVSVTELQDVDGNFLNAATVDVTLQDADGEEVDGMDWPLSLNYVAESDGIYRGLLQDTCVLVNRQPIVMVVDVLSGGNKGHWEIPATASKRVR